MGADTFFDNSLSHDIPQAKMQRHMARIVCCDIGCESNEASTSEVKTVSEILPLNIREQRAARRIKIKKEILNECNNVYSIVDEEASSETCMSGSIIIEEDSVDTNRTSGIEPEADFTDVVLTERDLRALRRLKIKEGILDECNYVHSMNEKASSGTCISGSIIIDEDSGVEPETVCTHVVLNERDLRAERRIKIKEEILDEPTRLDTPTSSKKVISRSKIKKKLLWKSIKTPKIFSLEALFMPN